VLFHQEVHEGHEGEVVSDNVGWASPTSQVFDLAVRCDTGHAAFAVEGWVSSWRRARKAAMASQA